ncbi:ATP-dependent zinc protease [Halovulum dunhuangense]|uniref:ATP-dependent zinc protease n=1 Tax=Halovulum dunhuangense TaxID=1505036 RepID=A0A849KYX3_9RHOB|nr:RimK/LysX family protein [Halovulum dunhuangense]NNU79032.1 ATP-dependent zinc protease [Halovulum dunhuangense]
MTERLLIGWRELVRLPALDATFRAKIDTGAQTSALHAHGLRVEDGTAVFRLSDRKDEPEHRFPVLATRTVRSSNGKAEDRPVIRLDLVLGPLGWPAEVTLTDRTRMKYGMLVGRAALSGRVLIDPSRSWMLGRKIKR